MLKEDIRFCDSTVFEGVTSVRAIIAGIRSGVNDRKIEKILYDKEKLDKNIKEIGYFKAVSKELNYLVEESTADEIDRLTLGSSHGGIVAIAGEREFPLLSDVVDTLRKDGFYCMIQGIEDPYNFGYALRSLYACGCDGILLAERNWFTAAGVVARSSAGASEMFPVFRCDPLDGIRLLKSRGYKIVSADERTDNLLGECVLPCPLCLMLGGEKRGISRSLLNEADLLVRIPYGRDFRASLSAASATTMFAYEILRQRRLLK